MNFQRLTALMMLALCSYTDIKKRKVMMPVIWTAETVSLVIHLICRDTGCREFIISLIPGILLLAVSRLTKGKIGEGDAFVIMALGIMTGWQSSVRTLMNGLVSASLFGIYLIFKNNGKKDIKLPLVPFILCGYIIMLGAGG